jgi:hypothetical protein
MRPGMLTPLVVFNDWYGLPRWGWPREEDQSCPRHETF